MKHSKFALLLLIIFSSNVHAISLDQPIHFDNSHSITGVLGHLQTGYPGGQIAYEDLLNSIGYISRRCYEQESADFSKNNCDQLLMFLINNKSPREIILEAAFSMLSETSEKRRLKGFGSEKGENADIITGDIEIDSLRQLGVRLLKTYIR